MAFNTTTGVYTIPAVGNTAIPGAAIKSADWNTIFNDLQAALNSLGIAQGTQLSLIAPVSTGANTNETTLQSFALPAGFLGVNGNGIQVTAWGVTAANGNNKRIRLYFGGTVVVDTGAVALNNGSWMVEMLVVRLTSVTQIAVGRISSSNNGVMAFATSVASPGETLANAITVKTTGLNGSSSAADITGTATIVQTFNMI